MHKQKKDKHFIKKPIYPGGLKAMRALIEKEMVYPQDAIDNKIEGTVILKYDVNYKGVVTSTKVMGGIGYGCDKEAKRLVKKLKFEIPKGPRRLKIKFGKTIRIHFKLPKKKKISKSDPILTVENQSISYNITSTQSQSSNNKSDSKSTTYSYTINI
ncbi:MAG: energy transducer TonB [Saprospiraceae bacterium]